MALSEAEPSPLGSHSLNWLLPCARVGGLASGFDELSEFVDDAAPVQSLGRAIDAVVEAFPDYRWDLQRLLIDGHWLAAVCTESAPMPAHFAGLPLPDAAT